MRELFYNIVLIKKKIENLFLIYIRKQTIRSAYRGRFYIHPFFILLFLSLSALIAAIILISKNIPEEEDEQFLQISEVNAEIFESSHFEASNDTVSSDRFLEPFPIVDGMQNMKYIIIADKYHRVMYIIKQGRKRWGVIKTYPIAIGANEGRKQREGDKKTPEGLYFIVDKKIGRELAENYGPHAFILNYPNRQDIEEGRGGSGIWIHGASENTTPIDSRGCVAMHNLYVKDLYGIIGDGLLTPVIIVNEDRSDFQNLINLEETWNERIEVAEEFGIDEATGNKIGKANVRQLPDIERAPITLNERPQIAVNRGVSAQNSQEIIQLINGWAVAWSNKNVEDYQSFYDTQNFFSDGMNWREFKSRKQGTFALYNSISVSVDNINVISLSDSTILAEFIQHYVTENSARVIFKRLELLKQQDDSWKITKEVAGR